MEGLGRVETNGSSTRPPQGAGYALLALVGAGIGLLTSACGVVITDPPVSRATAPAASAARTAGTAGRLEGQFETIVQAVTDSVVQIKSSAGLGSGVIFDDRGDIVTNAHVVGNATSFTVTLANSKHSQGSLVGAFQPDDLAVIRINAQGLHPATFGDSSQLQVGQIVLAIGNPLGLQSSVTSGIVSALNRTVQEGNGVTIPGLIQTSAAINPGNSGGALVDLQGHVIGIPTLAATDPMLQGGSAPGIGFAVNSNMVRDIAGQLVSQGKVTNSHRAYLGVTVGNVQSGNGVLVQQVTSGGPADRAGIRSRDLITSVDGKKTPSTTDLGKVLAGLHPGQQVPVEVQRADGSQATVSVTIDSFPGGG